ncbi:MAG: cation diffusion facilitator family transporter [Mucilaginibacter sp.]|uniref:cation diffusion facilitator family transporter n=1 Tax=Mucilaginibacter sp. TaxID=1882438 RepID=UPI0034E54583
MASTKLSIYSALAANLLIAATKFIAGAITNSGSMITEGIHSLVDTINELLLLLGMHKSKKQPDSAHPFGYGKELYFWSFIVSILIFGLGGGVSIYQGILHIVHPEQIGNPTVNYIVLGLSALFEGFSFTVALKQFNRLRGEQTFWQAIIKSKDPTTFLVLFEDGADLAGLLIVAIFTYLNVRFHMPYLDGVASVLVGLLLIGVSSILAHESRSLLMGEGVTRETKIKISELVKKDPAVIRVMHILSTYQSPEEIVLVLIVAFEENLNTKEINEAINRIRDAVKKDFTLVRFVMVQPETIEGASFIG